MLSLKLLVLSACVAGAAAKVELAPAKTAFRAGIKVKAARDSANDAAKDAAQDAAEDARFASPFQAAIKAAAAKKAAAKAAAAEAALTKAAAARDAASGSADTCASRPRGARVRETPVEMGMKPGLMGASAGTFGDKTIVKDTFTAESGETLSCLRNGAGPGMCACHCGGYQDDSSAECSAGANPVETTMDWFTPLGNAVKGGPHGSRPAKGCNGVRGWAIKPIIENQQKAVDGLRKLFYDVAKPIDRVFRMDSSEDLQMIGYDGYDPSKCDLKKALLAHEEVLHHMKDGVGDDDPGNWCAFAVVYGSSLWKQAKTYSDKLIAKKGALPTAYQDFAKAMFTDSEFDPKAPMAFLAAYIGPANSATATNSNAENLTTLLATAKKNLQNEAFIKRLGKAVNA